jgi:hypothetical protein
MKSLFIYFLTAQCYNLFMNKYHNGEEITKTRIQDEPWYPDYQCLLKLSMSGKKGKELTAMFLKDYREVFRKDYPDMDQLIRWTKYVSKP